MKITLNDGTTFEGTQAEYEAFLAFAERKVAEQSAPTSVKFAKGDSVKIVGLSKYRANHIGQIGVVTGEAASHGNYYVTVDGRGRVYSPENLELVEKESVITFEGAEYRKVDREAREGDVVVFKKGIHDSYINVGKAYKVTEDKLFIDEDGDSITVYSNEGDLNRTRETVDVYEPIAASKPKYEPKVGDIVVITGDSEIAHVENEIGDIGKITKVDNDETAKVHVAGKRNEFNYVGFEDMRPATAEEIAQYEKAVAKSQFNVGDYVKVVWSERGNEGKIVKITNNSEGLRMRRLNGDIVKADFLAIPLDETQVYGFVVDQFVKATEEEVKWAKLGRKVGEYKKGDIVRIIKATVSKNDGEYGTVEDVRKDAIGVRLGDGDYRGVYFDEGNIAQLIAPVESVLTHN